MRNKKSIAVLLGDPSGIGPELISKNLEISRFFILIKVSFNISFVKLKIITISPNLGFKTK